jgi:hypothetical protein
MNRRLEEGITASIQPELWVDRAGAAIEFYKAAFGARVMHSVRDGDDIVAQLSIGDAAFWVGAASSSMKRFSPRAIDGTTGRTLLVVENSEQVEREFGRLRNEWALLLLRVRGLDLVPLHANLTVLTKLGCALAGARSVPLAA